MNVEKYLSENLSSHEGQKYLEFRRRNGQKADELYKKVKNEIAECHLGSALRHNVGRCDGRSGKHARLRQRRKTSGGNGHGAFREMRHAQSPCHGGSAHGKPGCFNTLFQL